MRLELKRATDTADEAVNSCTEKMKAVEAEGERVRAYS